MGMDANLYINVTVSHHDWVDTDDKGFPRRVDNTAHAVIAATLGVSEFARATEGDFEVRIPVAYFRKDYDLHELIRAVAKGIVDANWTEYGGSCRLHIKQLEKTLKILEMKIADKLSYDGEVASWNNYKWSSAVQQLTSVVKYAKDNGITLIEYAAG